MRWSANQLTEGKVQGLGGEVTDDVGGVSSPEGDETLIPVCTCEGITDALVRCRQTTLLDLWRRTRYSTFPGAIDKHKRKYHLILVLNEELDTLNGGRGGLGNSLLHAKRVE